MSSGRPGGRWPDGNQVVVGHSAHISAAKTHQRLRTTRRRDELDQEFIPTGLFDNGPQVALAQSVSWKVTDKDDDI